MLDAPDAGRRAARGAVARLGGYAAGAALAAVAAALTLRHLGVDGFGRYASAMTLVTVVVGVTDAGLWALAIREYAVRDGADRDALMAELLGLQVCLTTAGLALAIAAAFVGGLDGALFGGTVLAAAGGLVYVVQNLLATPLAADLQLARVAGLELLRQATLLGLVGALVLIGAGVQGFLAMTAVANAVVLVATLRLVRGRIPLRARFVPAHGRALLRAASPFLAAAGLAAVTLRLGVLLTALLTDARQTGLFATSARVLEALATVPLLLSSAMLPVLARAARDRAARLRRSALETVGLALAAGSVTALALALLAEPIVLLLAGPDGRAAAPVLRIQALALLGAFVTAAAQAVLLALERYRAVLAANLAGLAALCVLCVLLVRGSGARGAAWATVGAEALTVAVSIALLAHPRARRSMPAKVTP